MLAKPADDPHFTSTATVTVQVLDENDNSPVFSFPSHGNNTVLVSAQAPVSYVVTAIRAYDQDAGLNGKLSYFVTQGNKGNTFKVDIDNGAISVNTDLSLISREDFELSLLVQDNGEPQYAATSTLRLSVRGDLPLYKPDDGDSLLSEENLTIVLIFALATVCVAIVIIIAIVVIVRKKSRNGDQKVEKEKQLMLCHEREEPGAGGGTKASSPTNYVSLQDDVDRTGSQPNTKLPPDSTKAKSNGYLKVDLRMEGIGNQVRDSNSPLSNSTPSLCNILSRKC